MAALLSDSAVIERVLDHITNKTTDTCDEMWLEPVDNYQTNERFMAELRLLRRLPVPFCPSAALVEAGSYVARTAAGTPLVAVRGEDGTVRAFRNACRHRGMQVVNGTGCARVFSCGYHGWVYGLDGSLKHIPHEQGFPGLDRTRHSLVPVDAIEKHGLVFVTQDAPISPGALEGLESLEGVDLIGKDQQIFDTREYTADVNWKLNMEGTLEGYHIKPAHKTTFYPYGFDNLNVVETFGNNSRVTYPFRRIEKLRDIAAEHRKIGGTVTYVYQLFPNVTVAVLSNHTSISISEPLSASTTRFYSYRLTNRDDTGAQDADLQRAARDASFVSDTGAKEDAMLVKAIQQSLASGANEHFTFGKFEKAIIHFHKTLTDHLEQAEAQTVFVR